MGVFLSPGVTDSFNLIATSYSALDADKFYKIEEC
jgi:hypothetical protein